MTFIKNNPLTSCYVLAFLIMHGLAFIVIFNLFKMPEIILWLLGSLALTLSAIIIAYLSEGKEGINKLIKPFLILQTHSNKGANEI